VQRVRLVVEGTIGDERMVLHAETASPSPQLAEQMVHSVREVTKLRGEVILTAPGALAVDGKVIDDQRSYQ
jgi:phenylacetate-CoA ligase